nr:short chain dehydrogenase andi [Quercus suber]
MTKEVHNDTYAGIDPTKADMRGKAIFITGASKGVGKATAVSFAKAGASYIAIGARGDMSSTETAVKQAAADAKHAEPRVLCLTLDVSDKVSVDKAIASISESFGKLDVVVNNAGILGNMESIAESDLDVWWQTMTVNLQGPYLITRACLPLLLKSELKTLITVASVGAHLVLPNISAYQISKLAVTRLMEFVHAEYSAQGVIAISVHPGNILTDIVGHGEGMDPEFKAVFTETPQLCADSLVFLSNERRAWLGSRYVNCTWDLVELCGEAKKKEIIDGDKLKIPVTIWSAGSRSLAMPGTGTHAKRWWNSPRRDIGAMNVERKQPVCSNSRSITMQGYGRRWASVMVGVYRSIARSSGSRASPRPGLACTMSICFRSDFKHAINNDNSKSSRHLWFPTALCHIGFVTIVAALEAEVEADTSRNRYTKVEALEPRTSVYDKYSIFQPCTSKVMRLHYQDVADTIRNDHKVPSVVETGHGDVLHTAVKAQTSSILVGSKVHDLIIVS